MIVGNDWDWRTGHVQRQTPRVIEPTQMQHTESAIMTNGAIGTFCTKCERLAFCPQCDADLAGSSVCHRTMSTHYRDTECTFNGNWMTDYKRKENK